MKALRIAILLGLPLALSCMNGPLNGDTYSGTIVGASFSAGGFFTAPNTQLDVQVLVTPTADTSVAANWTTLATTWSASSPYTYNGDDLYPWSTTVIPVPTAAKAARWPNGGLVKLRAVARVSANSYTVYTFDDVAWTECAFKEYGNGTPGQSIGTKCQGLGRGIVSMVSTLNNPADASPSGRAFLTLKGDSSTIETDAYYTAWSAPATLPAFKTTYNYPGSGDVTATFYNDSDLGVGREMHCWKFTRGPGGSIVGVACYVSNYSDTAGTAKFGNNNVTTTLANAIAHTGKFATVAMVTERPILVPTFGPVNFVAFDGSDNRVTQARLDNANLHKSIPNNCLTCHGVDTYYDSSTHSISGRANFLPFDPSGYKFSTSASYTRSAQEEAFRSLNRIMKETQPTAAITGLIDGSYLPSTVTTAGATWNDTWIPAAWTGGTQQEDYSTLYKGVVRPYCRTCHISAGVSRDFAEASDFENLKFGVMARACGNGAAVGGYFMPHAEHPFRRFWASGARAYLNSWGGDPDLNGCKP